MATSSSTNYNDTRNGIIADALTLLGVYRPGATVSSADYTFCSNILNKMVKAWQGEGIQLWTEEEGALFLTNTQNKYTLSASTSDVVGRNPIHTNLTAAGSGTSLTVTSTLGMTAADNVGICLDNNTIQWTTIVSVDSSTALTITASLTSAAASDNSVYTYTTAVGRPLYITTARFDNKSLVERPVRVAGRDEFMNMPTKNTAGKVNLLHYAPHTSSGFLYVWPAPDDVNECVKFTYVRTIEDFDNSTDNPDLPQEWIYTITVNLAVRVATAYGRLIHKTNPEMVVDAVNSLMQLQLFDVDSGSMKITPNQRYDD